LRDIINTILFFTENKITIDFIPHVLSTLDSEGKENAIAKMMISILGVVGEMEKTQIKERQIEGIRIAKLKGVYKGRVEGSKEDTIRFVCKEKNKKALEYLKKGYKAVEISKLTGLHINTITKIKRLVPQCWFLFLYCAITRTKIFLYIKQSKL
jgi:DNA invertase Pin-like site-specific DNA recombinase